jgi:hypothetical protein
MIQRFITMTPLYYSDVPEIPGSFKAKIALSDDFGNGKIALHVPNRCSNR